MTVVVLVVVILARVGDAGLDRTNDDEDDTDDGTEAVDVLKVDDDVTKDVPGDVDVLEFIADSDDDLVLLPMIAANSARVVVRDL